MKECFELISEQQGTDTKNKIYWLGEQLKDIIRSTPGTAELVAGDIKNGGMTLADCEKRIAEHAKSNGGCTPPQAADHIIREYFGITVNDEVVENKPQSGTLSLLDFME